MTAAGTVKWYDLKKGFGFITPLGGSEKDVFVHRDAVARAGVSRLVEGQKVTFELVADKQGRMKASNLRVTA